MHDPSRYDPHITPRPTAMPTRSAPLALLLMLTPVLASWPGGCLASAKESGSSSSEAPYTEVDHLNVGLPPIDGVDLGTPQATLENFIQACDRLDDPTASYSLNLNAIPPGRQPQTGAILRGSSRR